MVILARTIAALTILSFLGIIRASNFLPATWAMFWNIPWAVSNKWGTRGTSILTAGLGTWVHIYDIISECTAAHGSPVVPLNCANSVISSAFGIGLAAHSYQKVIS